MVKLYGFSLSIAYIARRRHPYIESLPTLWYWSDCCEQFSQSDALGFSMSQLVFWTLVHQLPGISWTCSYNPAMIRLLKEQEQQQQNLICMGIAKKTLKSFTTGRAIVLNLELTGQHPLSDFCLKQTWVLSQIRALNSHALHCAWDTCFSHITHTHTHCHFSHALCMMLT